MVAIQVPRRSGVGRSIYVWLVLPFAVLVGVAIFATYFRHVPRKPPPPGTRGALIWGDGVFSNRVEVKAWMTLHGASYRVWARHHPAALQLLPLKKHAKSAR